MDYESFDKDMDYRRRYDEWTASLPVEDRLQIEDLDPDLLSAKVESQGEGGPEIDLDRVVGFGRAPDEEMMSSEEGEEEEDPILEVIRQIFGELLASENPRQSLSHMCVATGMTGYNLTDDNRADVEAATERLGILTGHHRPLRRILGEIAASDKLKLTVECIAISTGICYQGISQTELAQRYRMTRAAVSKRCREILTTFGLSPSRAMRPESAVQTYRDAQRKLSANQIHTEEKKSR